MAGGKLQIFDMAGGLSFQSVQSKHSAFLTITPVRASRYYSDDRAAWDPSTVFGSQVLDLTRTASGNDGSALYAHMPTTGVKIAQGVDMSIAKTLNLDFVISEFGDVPVQIVLSGINFYGDVTCQGLGKVQHKQIMDFYEANKLSTNVNNRIDISITPAASPNSGSFRCALIKMVTATPAREGQGLVPAYTYEMNLIGVRR